MPSVLSADALTTLANLKDTVGIATLDTSKDNHLERCINRATWLIENEAGRKFNEGMQGGLKARKYTDTTSPGTHGTTGVSNEDYIYFDGTTKDKGGHTLVNPESGTGEFYLPVFPVQANSVLTFGLAVLSARAAGGETWDTASLVENDHFIVDRNNGILRLLGGVFAPGKKNYRVTMAAGFQFGSAQPYVPPDLEMLCIEMAKQLFRDNRAVTSESLGTWSRSYSAVLLQEDPVVQATLARYTRFSL